MKTTLKQIILNRIINFCNNNNILVCNNKNHILTDNIFPINDRIQDDVYVVAYPKSGITWMQNIISGLFFGCDPALAPDSLIQSLVPDLHWKKKYNRFSTPAFFKTHSKPHEEYQKLIYIVRDGRDVLVSFMHFYNALKKSNLSLDDVLYNEEDYIPFGIWSAHVLEWHNNPFRSEILFIRYEDLKNNLNVKLKDIAKFLNIKRDDNFLSNLANSLNIEKQQEKEKLFKMSHPDWPEDKLFHRKGIIGEGKALMTEHQLRYFNEKHRHALETFGYDLY